MTQVGKASEDDAHGTNHHRPIPSEVEEVLLHGSHTLDIVIKVL